MSTRLSVVDRGFWGRFRYDSLSREGEVLDPLEAAALRTVPLRLSARPSTRASVCRQLRHSFTMEYRIICELPHSFTRHNRLSISRKAAADGATHDTQGLGFHSVCGVLHGIAPSQALGMGTRCNSAGALVGDRFCFEGVTSFDKAVSTHCLAGNLSGT